LSIFGRSGNFHPNARCDRSRQDRIQMRPAKNTVTSNADGVRAGAPSHKISSNRMRLQKDVMTRDRTAEKRVRSCPLTRGASKKMRIGNTLSIHARTVPTSE
jgi:hypothetical protein